MELRSRVILGAAPVVTIAGVGLAQTASGSCDDVRASVAETLSDAETRSSLLAGADSGHDGKFYIAGDDFRLNIRGYMEFRYDLDFRDSSVNADDFTHGFQDTRTKLILEGTVNKAWDFWLQGNFDRVTGEALLEDAYARYNLGNGWKVLWGQFKLPLLREEVVFDWNQLAIERSVTNDAYTQKRAQGVQLSHQSDSWRVNGAFSKGLNSVNTDYAPSSVVGENTSKFIVSGEADWALTGRAEWLLGGDGWKEFDSFTSDRQSKPGLVWSGAVHVQQSPDTSSPTDVDRTTLEYTSDLNAKAGPFAFYGAFIGRYSKLSSIAGGSPEYNDFGGVAQAAWSFTAKDEVYGRWDALFVDAARFSSAGRTNFNFLTVGYNHHFAGNTLVFCAGAIYAFDNTSRLQTLGVLPDTYPPVTGENARGEVNVVLQFRVLF